METAITQLSVIEHRNIFSSSHGFSSILSEARHESKHMCKKFISEKVYKAHKP